MGCIHLIFSSGTTACIHRAGSETRRYHRIDWVHGTVCRTASALGSDYQLDICESGNLAEHTIPLKLSEKETDYEHAWLVLCNNWWKWPWPFLWNKGRKRTENTQIICAAKTRHFKPRKKGIWFSEEKGRHAFGHFFLYSYFAFAQRWFGGVQKFCHLCRWAL